MKKRLISLILALTLIIACSVTAMASDTSGGSDLSLNYTLTSVKVGETVQLTATLNGASPAPVEWTSSSNDIAGVDGNGLVTGNGLGIATITAKAADGTTATCTVHVAFRGIDVSRYQNQVDWNTVKSAGIDFAIIRTGFGGENWADQTDACFEQNYANATAAGLKVGVYHYSYATTVKMASDEADFCLHILNGRKLDYPVFYDIEESSQKSLNADLLASIASTFCNKIRAAGYRAGIYSSPSFFSSVLSSSSLDSYDKWVAHWGVNQPRYSKPFTIWQYGYDTVPGVSGQTDADYSYVDYSSTNVLQSDTVLPYTFGTNATYTYKVTTPLAKAPVASSSNPGAVSVSYYAKVNGGYLYRITNMGEGSALITTTAIDGSSTSFVATGRLRGVVSDTTNPFTMAAGATYQLKLTLVGGATETPYVSSGNTDVLRVISSVKSGSSFYVKIKAIGPGCTGLYTAMPGQKAIRQCIVSVANPQTDTGTVATGVVSDTTQPFTIKIGSGYQFKFTLSGGTSGTPYFSTGNTGVLKVTSVTKSGSSFYVKVAAVGSGCTAIYTTLPGQQPVRQCIITAA